MIALIFAAALTGMAGVDRPIARGADYLEACESKRFEQRIACVNFFSGVVGMAGSIHSESLQAAGVPIEKVGSFICPKRNTSNDEMERASLSVIRRDPAARRGTAAHAILKGLLEAFPCPTR